MNMLVAFAICGLLAAGWVVILLWLMDRKP